MKKKMLAHLRTSRCTMSGTRHTALAHLQLNAILFFTIFIVYWIRIDAVQSRRNNTNNQNVDGFKTFIYLKKKKRYIKAICCVGLSVCRLQTERERYVVCVYLFVVFFSHFLNDSKNKSKQHFESKMRCNKMNKKKHQNKAEEGIWRKRDREEVEEEEEKKARQKPRIKFIDVYT